MSETPQNDSSTTSHSPEPKMDLSTSTASADFEKISLSTSSLPPASDPHTEPSSEEEEEQPNTVPPPPLHIDLPQKQALSPVPPTPADEIAPSTGDPLPRISSAANFLQSLGSTTDVIDIDTTQKDLEQSLRIVSTIFPKWIQNLLPTQKSKQSFLNIRRRCIRAMAAFLYRHKLLPSNAVYDIFCICWKISILNLFFREIRPRGSHNIPKLPSPPPNLLTSQGRKLFRRISSAKPIEEVRSNFDPSQVQDPNSEVPVVQPHTQKYKTVDPLIFVAGPHNNQFLDGLILMITVLQNSGRRVSLLVAEKSMQGFIGWLGNCMQGISVARAQDSAKPGPGTLYIPPSSEEADPTIIYGYKTSFKGKLGPKMQLALGKSTGYATADVVEVLDDERVKVRKGFGSKGADALRQIGQTLAPYLEKGEAPPEDFKGLDYKIIPHLDQSAMYAQVYQKLRQGGCIGLFPEGGSHDRTDLLPLKAGVSIMALGAMASTPGLNVRIVPVGLSYFHAHKFRSRGVIEFGPAITIPADYVDDFKLGGEKKRKAVEGVMDLVLNGLKSVTVRAKDYDTLMLMQAMRRLYIPPGQHLSLGRVVELNRRFLAGYEAYKDDPRVKKAMKNVEEYNKQLRYMGLRDHQVESTATRPWYKSMFLLVYRASLLSVWTTFTLPGLFLNAPMFMAAKYISNQKAKAALAGSTVKLKGNDVIATWKVLIGVWITPPLYGFWMGVATWAAWRYGLGWKWRLLTPFATLVALPTFGYSALKFGEVGMDIYKSLPALATSLIPGNHSRLIKLREMRRKLQVEVNELVDELGPTLYQDFESARIVTPGSTPKPSSAPLGTPGAKSIGVGGSEETRLSHHPMGWLDEKLFGWRTGGSKERRSSTERRSSRGKIEIGEADPSGESGGQEGSSDDSGSEIGDFDQAIGQTVVGGSGESKSRPVSRPHSDSGIKNLPKGGKDE